MPASPRTLRLFQTITEPSEDKKTWWCPKARTRAAKSSCWLALVGIRIPIVGLGLLRQRTGIGSLARAGRARWVLA